MYLFYAETASLNLSNYHLAGDFGEPTRVGSSSHVHERSVVSSSNIGDNVIIGEHRGSYVQKKYGLRSIADTYTFPPLDNRRK